MTERYNQIPDRRLGDPMPNSPNPIATRVEREAEEDGGENGT